MKKLLSILTLFFFLYSCSVRTLKEVPKHRAAEISRNNIVVIHYNDFTFTLESAAIERLHLTGYLKSYNKSENKEQLYKELHLYINPEKKIRYKYNEKFAIPLEKITKAEVYEYNTANAVGNVTIILSAVAGIGFAVLLFIFSAWPGPG
ncbi:MAG: hypothetical protein GQ534_12180 [Candidatus Delongbacteria bacterium]|nr:hypothetical protein [Candidatus Delongbacteria bacterium]